MAVQVTDFRLLREQLLVRREKLETALAKQETAQLVQLLDQVDRALERAEAGTYGTCEVCHDTVEPDRLIADPLTRVCLGCLAPDEARALENDLELAARIQGGLLPKRDLTISGWKVAYHYQPAGAVSGDYLDLVTHGNDLYFMLGDVSGKGVAASMLMANLHAMFRVLIPTGLSLPQIVERANRIFCESTLPTQYATLICGRASACGQVEICNGGHLAPYHIGPGKLRSFETATVPVGLFYDQQFSSTTYDFSPGDSLVLYTDGLTEALGADGTEYGAQRLARVLERCVDRSTHELLQDCIDDVLNFRADPRQMDDQSMMVLQFAPTRQ